MSRNIDLGTITAFGLARDAGYTGTKEQFSNDLARSVTAVDDSVAAKTAAEAAQTAAETAQTAAESSATSAASSASAASTSEQTATQAATTATTAATAAEGSAATASLAATAAQTAQTAAETAQGLAETAQAAAEAAREAAEEAAEGASGAADVEDVEKLNAFMEINDFHGNEGIIPNTLETPYSVYDVIDNALILNDGSIRQDGTDKNSFVSPLVSVKSGTYGLKVVKHEVGVGNIRSGNNGFGFFAYDGETAVARPSEIVSLGNNIYLIDVPEEASYVRFSVQKSGEDGAPRTLEFFNQWILLPDANSEITEDFFDIGTPKQNVVIDRIKRSDGSYLELKDQTAREQIAEIDNSDLNAFVKFNDWDSDIINVLGLPYYDNEILKFATILSNGNIRNERNDLDRNSTVTPPVAVTPGTYALYVPNGKGQTYTGQLNSTNDGYGLFGKNGTTPVMKVSFTDLGNNIFQIVVPDNAEYIRFVFYNGYKDHNIFSNENVELALRYVNANWVLIKSDSTELTPADFKKRENGSFDRIARPDGSVMFFSKTELGKKKILVFGDSLWANDRTSGIANFLSDYSGATVYNCAVGGTRVTGNRIDEDGVAKRAFDGVYLIQAKLENDFTEQDAYAPELASYVANEMLPLLKSIDLSEIDIVILAWGHNDFTGKKTGAEVKAAYKEVVTKLLTAYPKLRFLICTAPWSMFNNTDGDEYQNANGDTLRDIDDAIVEGAKSMHIEVLDTLARLPWCALTKATYLDSDEVHPSTEGNKVYAHVVHGKLRSMF